MKKDENEYHEIVRKLSKVISRKLRYRNLDGDFNIQHTNNSPKVL